MSSAHIQDDIEKQRKVESACYWNSVQLNPSLEEVGIAVAFVNSKT